jgi:hypothetical protein
MYLKTGVNPSAGGFKFTQNDAMFGHYSRTANGNASIEIGSQGLAGIHQSSLYTRYTDNKSYIKMCGGAEESVTNTSGTGLYTIIRDSSTTFKYYKNKTKTDKNTTSDGLPPEIYLLAVNNNGTAAVFSQEQLALAWDGSKLTVAEQGLFYDIMVDGYLVSVGAKV